jgi:hypothetical protein
MHVYYEHCLGRIHGKAHSSVVVFLMDGKLWAASSFFIEVTLDRRDWQQPQHWTGILDTPDAVTQNAIPHFNKPQVSPSYSC